MATAGPARFFLRRINVQSKDGESAAQLAGFSEYFLSSGFGKREHHFLVFQRVQESDVVLIIDDDNGENGPQ